MHNQVIVEVWNQKRQTLQSRQVCWNTLLLPGKYALANIFCKGDASELRAYAGTDKKDWLEKLANDAAEGKEEKTGEKKIPENTQIKTTGEKAGEMTIASQTVALQRMEIIKDQSSVSANSDKLVIATIQTKLEKVTYKICYALLAIKVNNAIFPYNFIPIADINLTPDSKIEFTWKLQF